MNRWPVIPLAVVTLAGCGELPVGEPTVDVEAAQSRAERIDVRSMTRDEVHALMGQPWIADDAFGVEVYALQGKQRQVLLILGVPMPTFSDALAAYSLVTYGADGVVSALASDHAQNSGPQGPPTLVLRAGDFEFIHAVHDTLSTSLEHYLAVRSMLGSADTCTVLLGAERAPPPADGTAWFCSSLPELSVDGAGKRALRLAESSVIPYHRGMTMNDCRSLGGSFLPVGAPDRGSCLLTSRARYPLTLPVGTHVLHFTSGSDADVISTLECKAGEVSFATLYGKFTRCFALGGSAPQASKVTEASVSFGERAPAGAGAPAVVINDDGQWLYALVATAPRPP